MPMKNKGKINNQGFSLIEVLVSIVILAILLVPILHGFTSAAKVNVTAKGMQTATLLAQNLMEGMKSSSLEDIALQFNGASAMDFIHTKAPGGAGMGYSVESYGEGGYGEYMLNVTSAYERVAVGHLQSSVQRTYQLDGTPIYHYSPPHGKNKFYFGLENVEDQGKLYDVMVTLDSTSYSDSTLYPNSMNNYQFPRLLDLDEEAVALVDLEQNPISPDDQAVAEFYNMRLSYLAYLDSLALETPTATPIPAPPTISAADIEQSMSKKIEIILEKDVTNSRLYVTCQIKYECGRDLNEDGNGEVLMPVVISKGNYPIPTDASEEGNIFIFYTPSRFVNRDSIQIINRGMEGNLYLVNQVEDTMSKVAITKLEELGGALEVYSNLTDGQKTGLVTRPYLYSRSSKNNRIYEVTISVYPAGTFGSFPYGEPLVTMTSTQEEQS